MTDDGLTGYRLLGIYAHPDDESFGTGGTLARYAAAGVETHVCVVTDGDSGPNEGDASQSLVELRRGELECACRVLGAELWQLDYRDSGMEGTPANQHPDSLFQADLDRVVEDLVRVIRKVRPHVIVTHDPTGGYFHPDHIKVNQAVDRAWLAAGDEAIYPALTAEGPSPWKPVGLYQVVIPRSMIRWAILFSYLQGKNPRRYGSNGDVDLTRLGVPNRQVQVRLDVSSYLDVKEKASACHASQGGGAQAFPRLLGRRVLGYEYYLQAHPPGSGRHPDLFDGIGQTG